MARVDREQQAEALVKESSSRGGLSEARSRSRSVSRAMATVAEKGLISIVDYSE